MIAPSYSVFVANEVNVRGFLNSTDLLFDLLIETAYDRAF